MLFGIPRRSPPLVPLPAGESAADLFELRVPEVTEGVVVDEVVAAAEVAVGIVAVGVVGGPPAGKSDADFFMPGVGAAGAGSDPDFLLEPSEELPLLPTESMVLAPLTSSFAAHFLLVPSFRFARYTPSTKIGCARIKIKSKRTYEEEGGRRKWPLFLVLRENDSHTDHCLVVWSDLGDGSLHLQLANRSQCDCAQLISARR